MNHRLKYLLRLSWTLVLGMALFTACSDDDDDFTEEGGEELYMEARPVEDEIKTTVSTPYAVLGGSYDEMTTLLLRRMTGQRYDVSSTDSYLPDDVRTIFISNGALVNINEGMVKQIKKLFDNGASIYLHKPNSLALAFFYMAMYGELEQAMEDMKNGTTRAAEEDGDHDSFVMHRDQRNHEVLDIHNDQPRLGGTMTNVTLDDDGNIIASEEIPLDNYVCPQPTEYEYGVFAERVAQWLNEQESWERTATRATTDEEQLNHPSMNEVQIPCKIKRLYDDQVITWNSYLRYWVSPLYNIEKDEDYYHILIEEEFDASKCYPKNDDGSIKGDGIYYSYAAMPDWFWFNYLRGTKKAGIFCRYAAGYAYHSAWVSPSFNDVENNKGYSIRSVWNPQPENKGVTSQTETLESWSHGAEVSFSKDGVTASLSASHTYQEKVTTLNDEIGIALLSNDKYLNNGGYAWKYTLDEMKYEFKKAEKTANIKKAVNFPTATSLRVSRCTMRQSWNWFVSGTKKRGATPFTLRVGLLLNAQAAYISADAKQVKVENGTYVVPAYSGTLDINLPTLCRYKHDYSFFSQPVGALSTELESALCKINDYKEITENSGFASTSESRLRLMMCQKWGAIAKRLEGSEAINKSDREIIIELLEDDGVNGKKGSVMEMKDEKGEVIGTQLVIPAQSKGVIYIR